MVQVRVANRQDEPAIRGLVDSIYREAGWSINLESADSDLRNIEANYFGREGLFLVAENEGSIVGLAAARKRSETVLELRRLLVESNLRDDDVVEEMLDVILKFAPRLFYERIDAALVPKDDRMAARLSEVGFGPGNDQEISLKVV
jgi:N-acetylglutamate synthase-like GNAT family acetyltransferase